MRFLAAAVALALALASPAFGKDKSKHKHPRAARAAPTVRAPVDPYRGFSGHRGPHSPNPQWDVYRGDGTYAGSDPDPRIRLMLRFDDPTNDQ